MKLSKFLITFNVFVCSIIEKLRSNNSRFLHYSRHFFKQSTNTNLVNLTVAFEPVALLLSMSRSSEFAVSVEMSSTVHHPLSVMIWATVFCFRCWKYSSNKTVISKACFLWILHSWGFFFLRKGISCQEVEITL